MNTALLALLLSWPGPTPTAREVRFQGALLPALASPADRVEREGLLERELDSLHEHRPTLTAPFAVMAITGGLITGVTIVAAVMRASSLTFFALAVIGALPVLALIIVDIVMFVAAVGNRTRHDAHVAALRQELDDLIAQGPPDQQPQERRASIERELARLQQSQPGFALPTVLTAVSGGLTVAGLVMHATGALFPVGLLLLVPAVLVGIVGGVMFPVRGAELRQHELRVKTLEDAMSAEAPTARRDSSFPMVELAAF